MASNQFRPFPPDHPARVTGMDAPELPTTNVPATASADAGSAVFDPRDGFFPRELLESDVPRSPFLRTAPSRTRNVRWLVLAALLVVSAATYIFLNLQSSPGRAPVNASTPATPAPKSNATAGSIAPVATPGPKAVGAVVAPAALPVAPAPEVAKAPAIAPPVRSAAPAPEVGRAPAIAPPVRPAESRPVEPVASSPKSVVTHTRSAAAAAAGAEGAQESSEPRRAAVPAPPVAPPQAEARTNGRQGACSEALAALGLCVQSTRGENNQK